MRYHGIVNGWKLALVALFGLVFTVQAAAPLVKQQTEEGPAITAEPIAVKTWKDASTRAVTSAEIDKLIGDELKKADVTPAPRTTDEQFIRRVYLDLWGKPPTPAEIKAFVADVDSQKRSKLIEKLLASESFGRHWARYWHDVMDAHVVANIQSRSLARHFDRWMAEQINKNASWADVTREMLTVSGEVKFDGSDGKAGKAFFLASHMGADAVLEQAAETSRVFMGIQINCAQCHDHPFDVWKREQFHELAAYFARTRTRLVRDPDADPKQVRFIGVNVASTDGKGGFGFGGGGPKGMGFGGEHRMPDKDNPKVGGKVVHPKPLYGQTPSKGLKDADRRKALVDSMTGKDNYWFSGAYVNRVWGVLLGQTFYPAVDDLGPNREAYHGAALARLAASFAASGHDVKKLFTVIMNTETYQRQSRMGKSRGEHLFFASSYPTRLRPTALYESLVNAVGPLGGGGPGGRGGMMGGGPFGRFGGGGVEGMIRSEFGFDPSLKNEDVEGSIPQTLILMNNPALNQKIRANSGNVLNKILTANPKDEAAVEAVYLQTLCRKPTSNELTKALSYVKKRDSRSEAYEDVMWALINSAEFQTRR